MFLTILAGTVIASAAKAAAVTISAGTAYHACKTVSEFITRKVLK